MVGTGTLAFVRKQKAESYSDTALRLVQGDVPNRYGYGSGYTNGTTFACKFAPRLTPDVLPGTNAKMIEADLFFATATVLKPEDRIRLTHIYGELLTTSQTYAVVSGPVQTALGQRVGLELIVTE